ALRVKQSPLAGSAEQLVRAEHAAAIGTETALLRVQGEDHARHRPPLIALMEPPQSTAVTTLERGEPLGVLAGCPAESLEPDHLAVPLRDADRRGIGPLVVRPVVVQFQWRIAALEHRKLRIVPVIEEAGASALWPPARD